MGGWGGVGIKLLCARLLELHYSLLISYLISYLLELHCVKLASTKQRVRHLLQHVRLQLPKERYALSAASTAPSFNKNTKCGVAHSQRLRSHDALLLLLPQMNFVISGVGRHGQCRVGSAELLVIRCQG